MGKVSLGGFGGNKLVDGPDGWKAGSQVLPTIDGDKVKFQAGFKSADYPLVTASAALLAPDRFRLTVIGKSGRSDHFVFSSSNASDHVKAFAQNGGRVENATALAETLASPQPAQPFTSISEGNEPLRVPPPTIEDAAAQPTPAAPVLADKKSALANYSVVYLGGLPEFPDKKGHDAIDLLVLADAFHLTPTLTSRKWFPGMVIPYSDITSVEVAERTMTGFESLLGGKPRDLNQANNIHIAFRSVERNLVMRLEMLTGITVHGQAGKCREFMDRLRTHGILDKFRSTTPAATAEDIPSQIAKLASLRDQGILTDEEFGQKKAELLARM